MAVVVADAAVAAGVVVTLVMARRAARLRPHLLLRRLPRIFPPTPMLCLLLRQRAEAEVAVVVVEAVVVEVMWQS